MKKIEIDLDILKKNTIFAEEYIILSLIEAGENPRDFNWSFNLNDILDGLERELWVKPVEEGWILREKGRELFKDTSVEPKVDEIINYYKQITNSPKVSNKTEANRKPIRGRLSEGYTVEDLKSVIDVKSKQWKGTSMDMYLRIETLFAPSKFQGYIREANRTKPIDNGSIFTLAGEGK